jgi:hypothetical protein
VKREHRALGIVIKPIVYGAAERILLRPPVDFGIGEVGVFLKRVDVDLRQGLQLRARELALLRAAIPCVAKAENMSSKVQACRTAVAEPSGA